MAMATRIPVWRRRSIRCRCPEGRIRRHRAGARARARHGGRDGSRGVVSDVLALTLVFDGVHRANVFRDGVRRRSLKVWWPGQKEQPWGSRPGSTPCAPGGTGGSEGGAAPDQRQRVEVRLRVLLRVVTGADPVAVLQDAPAAGRGSRPGSRAWPAGSGSRGVGAGPAVVGRVRRARGDRGPALGGGAAAASRRHAASTLRAHRHRARRTARMGSAVWRERWRRAHLRGGPGPR